MSMATVSLLISVAALLLLSVWALRLRGEREPANVVGFDLAALVWAKCPQMGHSSLQPALAWFGISSVVGVVIPRIVYGPAYFASLPGLVVTLNYTVLVPCLLGVYMNFLWAANRFFDPKTLESLGFAPGGGRSGGGPGIAASPSTGFGTSGAVLRVTVILFLVAAMLFIQFKAINTAEDGTFALRPWVDAHSELSYVGAAYYALRGLDAMMALGLGTLMLFTTCRVLFFLKSLCPRNLYDDAGRPRREVAEYAGGLVRALLVSSAVIAMHGLGIFLENAGMSMGDLWLIAAKSTWAFWGIAAISFSAISVVSLFKFHRILEQGRELCEQEAIESLSGGSGTEPPTNGPRSGLGDAQLRDSRSYWQGRAAVAVYFRGVSTWPLPPGASLGIIASVALQILGWYLGGAGQ